MDLLTFAVQLAAAFVMGVVIGIERQLGQHPAGLRTNTLVCVGAAIFVSLGKVVGSSDPSRVAAQVVTGVGFLGGGIIIREGFSIRGLNTAATLWCSAAVGSLAGAGLIVEGLLATGAVLAVHLGLRPLVRIIDEHSKTAGVAETAYKLHVLCVEDQAGLIRSICLRHVNSHPGMVIRGIATKEVADAAVAEVVVDIYSSRPDDKYLNDLIARLNAEVSVSSTRWERVA
jgi:putative Mg2+ transporter-C (MgtC) family protein